MNRFKLLKWLVAALGMVALFWLTFYLVPALPMDDTKAFDQLMQLRAHSAKTGQSTFRKWFVAFAYGKSLPDYDQGAFDQKKQAFLSAGLLVDLRIHVTGLSTKIPAVLRLRRRLRSVDFQPDPLREELRILCPKSDVAGWQEALRTVE